MFSQTMFGPPPGAAAVVEPPDAGLVGVVVGVAGLGGVLLEDEVVGAGVVAGIGVVVVLAGGVVAEGFIAVVLAAVVLPAEVVAAPYQVLMPL